jgi:hypothetical protein
MRNRGSHKNIVYFYHLYCPEGGVDYDPNDGLPDEQPEPEDDEE